MTTDVPTNDRAADSRGEQPYATAKSLRILGKIRQHPEDFLVEELPAYHPSGHGDHLFLRIRKRRLNTPEAGRRIALALSRDAADVSWAGLKDRNAVTTQWLSVFGADPGAARSLSLADIEVLEVGRHPHKLRTGHLRGNRFSIRIACDPAALPTVEAITAELSERGVPNYFGEQRFGRDNLTQARRWLLEGRRGPRDRFTRKLLVSTLQSAVFNHWLAERLHDGLFDGAVCGDVMRKEDTGGIFIADDDDEAGARVRAWAISPTGPMFGAKMRAPQSEAALREQVVFAHFGLAALDLAPLRKLAPGTRRVARVRPAGLELRADAEGLRLAFELPPGAYATALLREILKPEQA